MAINSSLTNRFIISSYKFRENIQNAIKLTLQSDDAFLKKRYKQKHGKILNFDAPKTFNEKIQWRKIYDKNPLYVICADKYSVRDYVSKIIGDRYLVPLLGVYSSASEIDFTKLPKQFVIKATHGSGWNLLIKDKSKVKEEKTKLQLDKWLCKNFYPRKREWQYNDIKPQLIIEELLVDETNSIPNDYKFHVFTGQSEPKVFIQVDSNRFDDHTTDFFDENWHHLNIRKANPNSKKPPNQPENLGEMIRLAKLLASDFSYVRVDLYSVGSKVYFGELTFSPGAGFSPFTPNTVDIEWGKYFSLPSRHH